MPTLVRLLTLLGLVAGAIFAIMAALVHFVEPIPRPMRVEVPIPPRAASQPRPAAVPQPALPSAPAPVEAEMRPVETTGEGLRP
ncbi:hypothetical protein [Aureimonas sp. Leaf454]|uniref:hypothetical protein n=1 Tax=Aureimonas sp. Leaf454 TaxID=1736381 RepID=UPI001FCCF790|nr:hypothetical protein [Aureimonas sp. Leaf454]